MDKIEEGKLRVIFGVLFELLGQQPQTVKAEKRASLNSLIQLHKRLKTELSVLHKRVDSSKTSHFRFVEENILDALKGLCDRIPYDEADAFVRAAQNNCITALHSATSYEGKSLATKLIIFCSLFLNGYFRDSGASTRHMAFIRNECRYAFQILLDLAETKRVIQEESDRNVYNSVRPTSTKIVRNAIYADLSRVRACIYKYANLACPILNSSGNAVESYWPPKSKLAHASEVHSVVVFDETLYSCGADGTVNLWEVSKFSPLASVQCKSPIYCMAVYQHLLFVGTDKVQVYNRSEEGMPLITKLKFETSKFVAMLITESQKFCALTADGKVRIAQIDTTNNRFTVLKAIGDGVDDEHWRINSIAAADKGGDVIFLSRTNTTTTATATTSSIVPVVTEIVAFDLSTYNVIHTIATIAHDIDSGSKLHFDCHTKLLLSDHYLCVRRIEKLNTAVVVDAVVGNVNVEGGDSGDVKSDDDKSPTVSYDSVISVYSITNYSHIIDFTDLPLMPAAAAAAAPDADGGGAKASPSATHTATPAVTSGSISDLEVNFTSIMTLSHNKLYSYSPVGKGDKGAVRIWDLLSLTEVGDIAIQKDFQLLSITACEDGNLYAGTTDGHIKGWESAVITDFIISEKASQNLQKEFENLQFYDKRKGYVSDEFHVVAKSVAPTKQLAKPFAAVAAAAKFKLGATAAAGRASQGDGVPPPPGASPSILRSPKAKTILGVSGVVGVEPRSAQSSAAPSPKVSAFKSMDFPEEGKLSDLCTHENVVLETYMNKREDKSSVTEDDSVTTAPPSRRPFTASTAVGSNTDTTAEGVGVDDDSRGVRKGYDFTCGVGGGGGDESISSKDESLFNNGCVVVIAAATAAMYALMQGNNN